MTDPEFDQILHADIPAPDEVVLHMVEARLTANAPFPLEEFVDWVELRTAREEVSIRLLTGLRNLFPKMVRPPADKTRRMLLRRMSVALKLLSDSVIPEVRDGWTAVALAWRETLSEEVQRKWDMLLTLANQQTSNKPAKSYLISGAKIVTSIPLFPEIMRNILESLGRDGPVGVRFLGYPTKKRNLLDADFSDLLRALIWLCPPFPSLVDSLRDAAGRCTTKIPGYGPLSSKIGAACSYVLSQQEGEAGARAVFELQTRVKHKSTRKGLEKAIAAVEARKGVSRDQLEEGLVPDLGFSRDAVPFLEMDGRKIVLLVSAAGRPQLFVNGEAGKERLVPLQRSSLRHSEEAKVLTRDLKRVWKSEATRLERLMRSDRKIPFEIWQKHYAAHPIVGALSRLLLWRIGETLTAFSARNDPEALDLLADYGIPFLPKEDEPVRLWHPAELSAGERQKWERWVLDRRLIQPFQQALRTVYTVKKGTEDSHEDSRFAGGVIHQGTLAALCRERGWDYSFHGGSAQFEPSITFSKWSLKCGMRLKEGQAKPALKRSSPVSLEVVCVRFVNEVGNTSVPLQSVPPVLLSEALRDVDLFLAASARL